MAQKPSRPLPFQVLAPALVLLVGVLAAIGIAMVGVRELRDQSDEAAAQRSELLGVALSARLGSASQEQRGALIERAASRSGAEFLLLGRHGEILVDGTQGPLRDTPLELLSSGEGETQTALGRARFYVAALPSPDSELSLVSFVSAPEAPFATSSLVASVATLTALLMGAAALVAFALARDVHADVAFVRRRIADMAQHASDPAGQEVPVRSVDQVGLLTSAFNGLVDRFAAAERAYRQDLSGALAYDRDRSEFLAALSHELRTPLNAILGFTEVLLSEVDGPLSADARENLDVVRSSGEHLRALIDDILDLSALESGELKLHAEMVDIFAIAAEVVREAQVSAANKGLSVELSGRSALAHADARRVRQILGNLVGNAVKFTERGLVLVTIDPRDGGAAIVVRDTGPGIAPEDREAIFEEYFQSKDARRHRVGTGLGLAITNRLVQMHRGFIDLTSELGKGSTFTIVLPSSPPPASDVRKSFYDEAPPPPVAEEKRP
ncbi:MAG TPA: HAMP domain-containing sensor histidine kinase [Polyangiaceae bacterium]|nr:HAMP domain-containing sensor histidine kinase [Polyangiaceae bacterium]